MISIYKKLKVINIKFNKFDARLRISIKNNQVSKKPYSDINQMLNMSKNKFNTNQILNNQIPEVYFTKMNDIINESNWF